MSDTEKRIAVQPPVDGAGAPTDGATRGATRSWTAAEFIAGGLFLAACGSLWNYVGALLRPNALASVSGPFEQDILPSYQAAQQILQGHGAAMYNPAIVHGYTYSPVFAWLFTPLALLPRSTALVIWYALASVWLWIAVGMLALLINEVLPAQLRALRFARLPVIPILAAIWLGLAPSVQATLEFGQVDYINLALLAGAFVCLLRRRDGAGGALIVLAALLKITPIGLLAVFLVFRRWRAFVFGVLTLIICIAVTSLDPRVGIQTWLQMPQGVGANFDGIFLVYSNESLASVFAHLATIAHLHLSPSHAEYVGFAIAAPLFLAALAFGLRRETGESRRWIIAAAAGLGAVLLASPLNWDHTYVVAAVPAVILLSHVVTRWFATRRIGWFELIGALCACVIASWPLTAGLAYPSHSTLLAPLAGTILISARPVALLTITCLLLWTLWQSRPPRHADMIATA